MPEKPAMTRANLRWPLLTGKERSPPFKDHDDSWLARHWPDLLDCHFISPRPGEAACMADVAKMLDTGYACITTQPAADIVTEPRKLSEAELEAIKVWHEKKTAQLLEQRGDLYVAERNLASLARSHHDEAMEAHALTQQTTKDATVALKSHISEELAALRGPKATKRQQLVGKKVVARSPDHEMGEEVFEICQTFIDGQTQTAVCLLKAEGKPTLLREFSKLAISDKFVSESSEPVRVVVVSRPDESVLYHTGWRGSVVKTSSTTATVNFPYLGDGKIGNKTVAVRKEHLEILAADDVSQMPNKHPWVGESVKVQEGMGKIVHVAADQGQVKILLDNSKRKKFAFVESRGSSFDELFGASSPTTEVLQQPQAVPAQRTPEEAVAHADDAGIVSVADSDAESDVPALVPLPSGDGEPVAPAEPGRKRGAE